MGSETLGVIFFSFQQGGDSVYAAALGMLTVVVSIRVDAVDAASGQATAQGSAAVARLTLERLGKRYRRLRGVDGRVARGCRRGVRRHSRGVGLRQDDAAAAGRGIRSTGCRANPDRRYGGLDAGTADAPRGSPDRHRFPVLRAVAAHDRGGKRRVRLDGGRCQGSGARAARARRARARPPRRFRGASTGAPVRAASGSAWRSRAVS